MARAGNFREKRNEISHLTHEHLLKEMIRGNSEEFMCKACCTAGDGVRYVCSQSCNFSLHEICARAETFIFSHIHAHKLELNWEGLCRDQNSSLEKKIMRTLGGGGGEKFTNIHGNRRCDVCEEEVVGLYYTCAECNDFYLHPVCTKFPDRLPHVIDRKHDLTFQCIMVNSVSPSICRICHEVCSSPWRYRCGPCGYDIHFECVNEPLSSFVPPPQPDFSCRSASMPRQSQPPMHQQKPMAEKHKSGIHYHHQEYFTNDHAGYVAIGVPIAQPYHYGSQMQAQTPHHVYQHSQHQQQPGSQPEVYQKHQQQPYMKPDTMYDMPKHQQQQFIKPDPDIQENTGKISSEEVSSSSSSGNPKKRLKKRKIFGIVAQIAVTVTLGVVFGLPVSL